MGGPSDAVIVYGTDEIKFADGLVRKQDGYVVNNGEKFYAIWFDHSMLPEDQREQPWVISHPK